MIKKGKEKLNLNNINWIIAPAEKLPLKTIYTIFIHGFALRNTKILINTFRSLQSAKTWWSFFMLRILKNTK